VSRLLIMCLALGICVSCGQRESSQTVVVHVLRDPSAQFAGRLRRADSQFALTKPHLKNGKMVGVATNEGNSFPKLLQRIEDMPPSLLILDSQSNLPADVASRVQLGRPEQVCGGKQAYMPIRVSGEEREAAEMYLRFLEAHCDGEANQPSKPRG
jgi:hypothetical protein